MPRGLAAAHEAWRDWLKSERRLADHTLIAYEHDVAAFLDDWAKTGQSIL